MLVLVLTQSNPNPSKSSALSFIPLAALPRLAAVTPAEYRNTSLHSPRQVTCIALHCLAATRSAQEYTPNTPLGRHIPHTHTHTPRRRPDLSAPPPPINPLCRRRRLPPSDLPCPTSAASCNTKQQHPLATRRRNHPMLRNYPRLFNNLPADTIVAPSPTGIGFGHAACPAT